MSGMKVRIIICVTDSLLCRAPVYPPLCGSRDFATMCSSQLVRRLCEGGKFVL